MFESYLLLQKTYSVMASIDRSKYARVSFWMWIDYIKMEYGKLREFIEESSQHVENEKQQIVDFCKSEEAKYGHDKDAIAEMYEWYQDDYYRYDQTFKHLLLNTTFVSACALFEFLLKRTCVLNFKYVGESSEVIRPNGNYLATYQKFLVDKVSINLSEANKEWINIRTHYRVRNSITHDHSRLELGSEVHQFLSKSPFVTVEENLNGFAINDKAFVLEFIDVCEKYLVLVADKLSDKYRPTAS